MCTYVRFCVHVWARIVHACIQAYTLKYIAYQCVGAVLNRAEEMHPYTNIHTHTHTKETKNTLCVCNSGSRYVRSVGISCPMSVRGVLCGSMQDVRMHAHLLIVYVII